MGYKEPWNIALGYVVNCDCEDFSGSTTGGTTPGSSTDDWNTKIGNSIDFTYDVDGNVLTAIYNTLGVPQFTITYTYDGSGNVTSVVTT